jgi:hypothetical protein
MRALPGAELACRARNYDLPAGQHAVPHGVISYYAAATLAEASTVGDWLACIETTAQQDVQAGKLPPLYRPELYVLGDSNRPVPGAQS